MFMTMNKHGVRYYSDHPRSVARVANRWSREGKEPIIMVRREGRYCPLQVEMTTIAETMRMMYQRVKEMNSDPC